MTVHQLRPRTPAESALFALAPAAPAAVHAQAALDALHREGLPNRRVEAWHYTDLRQLIARATSGAVEAGQADDVLAPLLAGSLVVELGAGTAPSGADRDGLSLAHTGDSADWRTSPNHLDRPVDTVRLLNAAFGATAVRVSVEAGTELPPIELRAQGAAAGAHGFAICDVAAGAKAVIVERLSANAGGAPFSTGVSNLDIGDGAEVLWIVDQTKSAGDTHLGQLNVRIGADARFKLFVLNAGGALVRYEVHSVTVGEGADIAIRGVNLLRDKQHVDVTTTLVHAVPHTTATEVFRNVVTGGTGVFQGMIKVAPGAQKTDAKMACNSLLLSDEGEFLAKPELEIFADDVQCGHGATAGEINEDHLFYLMSRGIPEASARALLVKAFVAEVVEELEHEAAVEALEARIDAWLELSA
ncbi:Fe-S cluster assembly protein SufD [Antarcticirhabdus aurantiaca]|uniref:Fe-S cluster assembly protein SufD n=1 Tax=Antarcticirhabdus aurantiaca TaxID=2606717 RepID=A0ACD4NVM5_9HYPH|nr:Fe-S cluster assembly protein SufD [Antarcticirhabdus aurantiaca]WAJ31030.1 Fe-S cluster assembly protein SufD [Jeongeuplla avenae]